MEKQGEKCEPLMQKEEKEKVVIIAPNNAVGRILIREDTILNNLQGCAGCGRAQFTCAGVQKQWSVLCWGKQSDKKYYTLLVLLSATFAFSLIGAIFLCFTDTVNDAIISNMALRNNSIAYSMWRRPTVQPTMRVYVFNYTNWEKVRDGRESKLHVQEVGPYVYAQQVERVNTKFEGDTLTYQESSNFRHLPEESAGAHFDQVSVPNLPLLALAVTTETLTPIARIPVRTSLAFASHKEAFLKLPVQRFLWGYEDDIINFVKPFLSIKGQLTFKDFGLLVTKNGTAPEHLTINTGELNMDRMNVLERFNDYDNLQLWNSPACNNLYSTDGSLFPPSLLDRKRTLHVIYPSLCRRFPYKYVKDVELNFGSDRGVHLLRYALSNDVFDDPPHNPDNQCFCEVDSGVCPPRGVINVTTCAKGFPVMVSFPHFERGDPSLTERISGLKPNPGKHENFVDIHPTLGIALRGRSSLQLNVQVKTSSFEALRFMKNDMILPIAYVEMSVEKIPENIKTLIYHGTYSAAAAQLGLTIFFIIAFVMSAVCLLAMILGRRRKPCAVVKVTVDAEQNIDTPLKQKSQLS